jgi:tetratricopeptide (TPR) repeat protein
MLRRLIIRLARAAGGSFLLLALLAGCASAPQTRQLLDSPPARLPARVEILAAPFFPQEDYQCGPAALATVLSHSGVPVHPDALAPQVFIPERQGSLQLELIAATRRHGRVPYVLAPRLEDVLREVSAGNPVLVLQNLALNWYPRWHYAVIVGFDVSDGSLVMRSGRRQRHVVDLSVFERTWARGGRWALVILPPDRVPVTAEPLPFLRSAASFEQLGQLATARVAYRTAVAHWPDDTIAWMALGNAAYALQDASEAERAYRRALDLSPDYAPALNNLAQLLADQGRTDEALPLARKAVALDATREAYRDTLETLRKSLGSTENLAKTPGSPKNK